MAEKKDKIAEEKTDEIVNPEVETDEASKMMNVVHVGSIFENYFLDYASYVNLNRAIPEVVDGLKPVQRRILHSMDELEDGRYNKVANIIGNTMKYHPHGDASIGDALVQLGQKGLLIDTQGNWGNILTGDDAAAPRYIEARLSKFAIDVVFNHKTTEWQLSYDGRNKEPITLPIKFPLLLAQGTEGIGVSIATKILPHNFNELLDASVAILENKDFEIYPDFPTGGSIDVSRYNEGVNGKILNRAKISILDKKTLVITEIPYGTNTSDLIQSITPQIEKGKLKIKKIDDNTAGQAEILLHLHPGVSPDQTIDALYAFTDCSMSYSPNACVIFNGKPCQMSVKEILRINTNNTVNLLRRELEIALEELSDQWHKISLEKIFFEKGLYKQLEKDAASWDDQITSIERAFDKYRKLFAREITRDDVLHLCDKPVKKISKFDIKEAEDKIADIEANIDEVKNHLDHLIDYAINYFKQLKKKYGKGRERKTEIRNFDNIVAATVAVANQKLYVDRAEGFVGTALKRDENVEYVCDCSDIDEVIVFRDNGTFMVSKVSDKQFFGKDIILVEVFKRNDDRTIYNMIYSDGMFGTAMVKRFAIGGVTRDKEYVLTKGKTGSKVLYLTSNPNGEAEKVRVFIKQKKNLKKPQFDFDFSTLAIKGRASMGNILSRNPVKKVELCQKGVSTLSAINIYYDEVVGRLNSDERGVLLGSFKEDDKIITVYDGYFRLIGFDVSAHFDDNLQIIKKYNSHKILSVVYFNKKEGRYMLKRFNPDNTPKKIDFVPQEKDVKMMAVSIDYLPQLEVSFSKKESKELEKEVVNVADFVEVMNVKAKGKKLNFANIKSVKFVEPLPYEEPEEEETSEDELEEVEPLEDVDMQVAKDIYENIDSQSDKDDDKFSGDQGEQLTLEL